MAAACIWHTYFASRVQVSLSSKGSAHHNRFFRLVAGRQNGANTSPGALCCLAIRQRPTCLQGHGGRHLDDPHRPCKGAGRRDGHSLIHGAREADAIPPIEWARQIEQGCRAAFRLGGCADASRPRLFDKSVNRLFTLNRSAGPPSRRSEQRPCPRQSIVCEEVSSRAVP